MFNCIYIPILIYLFIYSFICLFSNFKTVLYHLGQENYFNYLIFIVCSVFNFAM